MNKSTFNHRPALLGMLIVTLGLSKAWLQTARHFSSSIDLAAVSSTVNSAVSSTESAADPNLSDDADSNLPDKIYTVHDHKNTPIKLRVVFKNEKTYEVKRRANGKLERDESARYKTVATFPDSCAVGSCLQNIDLTGKDTESEIDSFIKETLANLATAGMLNHTRKKDCDAEDAKERYRCLRDKFSTSEEYADRDDRREAFQSEIVDELQEELNSAETDRERKEIMRKVRIAEKEFKTDPHLKADANRLLKGAEDLNRVAQISREMALYPGQSGQYLEELNNLAFKYNMKANPQLNCVKTSNFGGIRNAMANLVGRRCYSDSTRESIGDWAEEIYPLANETLNSPGTVARRFYPDEEFPTLGGDDLFGRDYGREFGQDFNRDRFSGSRTERTNTELYGIYGLPSLGGGRDSFGGGNRNRFGGNDRNYFGGSDRSGFANGNGNRSYQSGGAFLNRNNQTSCQPSRFGNRSTGNYSNCNIYPQGTGLNQWGNNYQPSFGGGNTRMGGNANTRFVGGNTRAGWR